MYNKKCFAGVFLILLSSVCLNSANLTQEHSGTALHAACSQVNLDIVKSLINANADVNKKDSNGNTPILVACKNKKYHIVDYILSTKKININDCNKIKNTLLHLLCADAESKEAIKLLENIITHKHIFIEPFNVKFKTPFHVACKNNNLLAVKLLLATNKIDVQFADNNGFTLLHFACKNSCNKEIITELLQKGCDTKALCTVNDIKRCSQCFKEYCCELDIFQFACMYGNKDAIKCLLEIDEIDINIADDSYENTPLALAVYHKKEEIIEILLQQKNINENSVTEAIKALFDFIEKSEDECELTIIYSFMYSFIHHKWEIITNEHKEKILDFCMEDKKNDLIKLIINKINQKNKDYVDSVLFTDEDNLKNQNNFNVDKKELLLKACENNNIDLVNILLEEVIDINFKDEFGRTPFIIACRNKSLELAQLLIEKNANINTIDLYGFEALGYVINSKNLDLATIIINHPHFANDFAKGRYYLDLILNHFNYNKKTEENIKFYKNITKILLLKNALYSEHFNDNDSVAKLLEEVKTEILQESKANLE